MDNSKSNFHAHAHAHTHTSKEMPQTRTDCGENTVAEQLAMGTHTRTHRRFGCRGGATLWL